MKLLRAAAFAAAALSLCACSSTPTVRLDAGRALLVAEAATDGANHTATLAASHLTAGQAQTVKKAVDAANTAVGTAHSLYTAGNLSGAVSALDEAFANVAVIQGAK